MNKNEIATEAAALSNTEIDARIANAITDLAIYTSKRTLAVRKAQGLLAEAAKRGATWTVREYTRTLGERNPTAHTFVDVTISYLAGDSNTITLGASAERLGL